MGLSVDTRPLCLMPSSKRVAHVSGANSSTRIPSQAEQRQRVGSPEQASSNLQRHIRNEERKLLLPPVAAIIESDRKQATTVFRVGRARCAGRVVGTKAHVHTDFDVCSGTTTPPRQQHLETTRNEPRTASKRWRDAWAEHQNTPKPKHRPVPN